MAKTPTPTKDFSAFNDDFPVSLNVFLQRIAGTHDEVWSKLLKNAYGTDKRSERGWAMLLDTVKGT